MPEHLDSTSEERTRNNAMRHKYRILSEAEKSQMATLKDLGQQFLEMCDELGNSRELEQARINAEQAVMWAVKHVTA